MKKFDRFNTLLKPPKNHKKKVTTIRISFIYNKKNLVKFGFMITKTCKKMKKPQKSKEASLSMDKFNQVFFHILLKPRKMI